MRDSVFLLCLAAVLVLIAGPVFSQSVTVDHIDGLEWDSTLAMGPPLVYHLRFTNSWDDAIRGFSAGFRVYSLDGAEWTTTSIELVGFSEDVFDMVLNTFAAGVTGSDADTVYMGGVAFLGPGMPPGYDEIAATITIGPVDQDQKAKTICLDSSWYPSGGGQWMWQSENDYVVPEWGGPYCYEVGWEDLDGDGYVDWFDNCPDVFNILQADADGDGVGDFCDNCIDTPNPDQADYTNDGEGDACCCVLRGDIDHDGELPLSISDLMGLVSHMFGGPDPVVCPEGANIDNSPDGEIDIGDLVYFVNYMFLGGPPPAPCD